MFVDYANRGDVAPSEIPGTDTTEWARPWRNALVTQCYLPIKPCMLAVVTYRCSSCMSTSVVYEGEGDGLVIEGCDGPTSHQGKASG